MAITTTNSVSKPKEMTDADFAKQIKELGDTFSKEKKRKVTIPKVLSNSLGAEVPFTINGVTLVLEVGKAAEIPETFADHVDQYLENLA